MLITNLLFLNIPGVGKLSITNVVVAGLRVISFYFVVALQIMKGSLQGSLISILYNATVMKRNEENLIIYIYSKSDVIIENSVLEILTPPPNQLPDTPNWAENLEMNVGNVRSVMKIPVFGIFTNPFQMAENFFR